MRFTYGFLKTVLRSLRITVKVIEHWKNVQVNTPPTRFTLLSVILVKIGARIVNEPEK